MASKPVRVLLVDDDKDDYVLTRELFADMAGAYALDWENDFDGGLAAMCRGEHDVYLIDFRLGKRNGLDLLREAANSRCKGPVIVLTGQGERDIDLAAMRAGAADYLDKAHLDAAQLERSIRYAMQHRSNEEELERRVEERTDDLARANAELQETDRRKDEFLATLAHELRNPLASVRNALQIIRMFPAARPEIESATQIMERQLAQLVRLVDDLLDVSRISRGTIGLKMERLELATVVAHAVEATAPLCKQMDHRMTTELPPQSIHVRGDAVRLTQVIGNLLNNACKYSERGGDVRLRVERIGDEAVIAIRDSGIGIDPEQLSRIFDMFVQVDPSIDRSHGGLGVGLTLVKQLVELHGGIVEARSEGAGRGSEFIVRLPVAS